MKLYIKQHIFTWGDKFTIYDEFGNDIFYVQGEIFTWGKKLHLYDLNNNELAYIQEKIFAFLPKFYIFRNGYQVAEIIKEFTFFKQEYTVNGPGWSVHGDYFAHEYEVTDRNRTIASVSKEWFTFGDAYMINIDNNVDIITALATVLVIDACIDAAND